MTPITKLLIANRGEIAVRIIRTCRRLGIASVAAYSEADAGALHMRLADEAVCIGPPPAQESYLHGERIIAAARRTGCDAIHPGCGFLAENAEFAQAVADAGLIFVGPAPDAIRRMGSKIAARAIAQQAGVPVAPGFEIENEKLKIEKGDPSFLNFQFSIFNSIGFPLLIKASAGGGGRGMRLVTSMDEFGAALESARREALKAFGDDRVYVEKWIAHSRHIEVQVLGDVHGNLVHLFERECSIQRRHQKIIEESPSPFLDDDLRERMGRMAVALARAVNYTNAGTVEFIVDPERNVYFLEMNTRLQVEHPVTESVVVAGTHRFSLDLVEWQLRIAQGESLPFAQADLRQRGHAIECRIVAEDPASGFLPATGRIVRVVEPLGADVRVDSGVERGSQVTPHYDSLLAKLIVRGETRGDAIRKMDSALRDYTIEGVTTNLAFLRDVITHPAFRRGDTTTDFTERYFAGWPSSRDEGDTGQPTTLSASLNPWQRRDRFRVGEGTAHAGQPAHRGRTEPTPDAARPDAPARQPPVERRIEAPMPGQIVDVRVKAGDEVTAGATLVVLEAMKMETRLTAPAAGRVRRVHCAVGQTVERGQVLVELE
ncbi:MAG: ATP-grasp domain-containing protein [Candidatus Roseilinea sp.]|nr:ATP-grasp domain-containing protein [Candidatus Roseilinea sp.]